MAPQLTEMLDCFHQESMKLGLIDIAAVDDGRIPRHRNKDDSPRIFVTWFRTHFSLNEDNKQEISSFLQFLIVSIQKWWNSSCCDITVEFELL